MEGYKAVPLACLKTLAGDASDWTACSTSSGITASIERAAEMETTNANNRLQTFLVAAAAATDFLAAAAEKVKPQTLTLASKLL